MLFIFKTILLLNIADFENGSEGVFLSLRSSVRFNSLKILNQERNVNIRVSKILSIKESVGYLVG